VAVSFNGEENRNTQRMGFWLELKPATTITAIFIVPVVVDIMAMSTVARKCYMKMPTLIQKIIVP
jgi:hypothetical protein